MSLLSVVEYDVEGETTMMFWMLMIIVTVGVLVGVLVCGGMRCVYLSRKNRRRRRAEEIQKEADTNLALIEAGDFGRAMVGA